MKIGMVLDKEFPVDERVENEAIALIQAGFEVHLLCFSFGKYKKEEIYKGILVHRVYMPKFLYKKLSPLILIIPIYSWFWKQHLKRFISTYNINLLHVHDLAMCKPATEIKPQLNVTIIADLHENFPATLKSRTWTKSGAEKLILKLSKWEKAEEKFLKKVDELIVLSSSFRNLLLKKYSFLKENTVSVYPNVPNINKFKKYNIDAEIINKNNSFIVFYFGRIAHRRGVFTIFESLEFLSDFPDIKYLLVGPIDKADRKKFNVELNKNPGKNMVDYISWIDISQLPSFASLSDLCVSPILKNPQHDSGVSNKVYQYMLFGKPVVVSNSTEQKRLVEETGCGLVHESGNAEELAEKIIYLYKNPELREEMGEKGKKSIINKYNLTRQSEQLINLYKTINN